MMTISAPLASNSNSAEQLRQLQQQQDQHQQHQLSQGGVNGNSILKSSVVQHANDGNDQHSWNDDMMDEDDIVIGIEGVLHDDDHDIVGCHDWMNDDDDDDDGDIPNIDAIRGSFNDNDGNNNKNNSTGENSLYPTKRYQNKKTKSNDNTIGTTVSSNSRQSLDATETWLSESTIADVESHNNTQSPISNQGLERLQIVDLDMDLTDSCNNDDSGANFYNDITATYHHPNLHNNSNQHHHHNERSEPSSLSFTSSNHKKNSQDHKMMVGGGTGTATSVGSSRGGGDDEDHFMWGQNYTISKSNRHQYDAYDDDDDDEDDEDHVDHDAILYDDDCTEVTIAFKSPTTENASNSNSKLPHSSLTVAVASVGGKMTTSPSNAGGSTCASATVPLTISTKQHNPVLTSGISKTNGGTKQDKDDDEDDDGSVDDVMLILEGADDDCSLDEFFSKQNQNTKSRNYQQNQYPSSLSGAGGDAGGDGGNKTTNSDDANSSTADATVGDSNASIFLQESFSTESTSSQHHHHQHHHHHHKRLPSYVPVFHDLFEERRAQLAASMEATRRSRNRVFLQSHVKTRASLAYVLRDIERSSRVVAKHVVRYWEEQNRIQKQQLLLQQQLLIQQQQQIVQLKNEQMKAQQQLLTITTASNHSSNSTIVSSASISSNVKEVSLSGSTVTNVEMTSSENKTTLSTSLPSFSSQTLAAVSSQPPFSKDTKNDGGDCGVVDELKSITLIAKQEGESTSAATITTVRT